MQNVLPLTRLTLVRSERSADELFADLPERVERLLATMPKDPELQSLADRLLHRLQAHAWPRNRAGAGGLPPAGAPSRPAGSRDAGDRSDWSGWLRCALPHAARAIAQLRVAQPAYRWRELAAALVGRFDLVALVLGRDGRITAANEAANALLASGAMPRTADNRIIAEWLGDAGAQTGMAPQIAEDGEGRVRMLAALEARIAGAETGSRLMLVAGPVDRPVGGVDLLARLYRFSAAEARLAGCLVDGWPLKRTAAQFTVSVNTVRTQLNSLFVKTGTHRQIDLVKLLLSAGGSAPDSHTR